jgi:hypothetical protein
MTRAFVKAKAREPQVTYPNAHTYRATGDASNSIPKLTEKKREKKASSSAMLRLVQRTPHL